MQASIKFSIILLAKQVSIDVFNISPRFQVFTQ